MHSVALFVRFGMVNPVAVGILSGLLVFVPILGIWAIHKYGWQHWAPFDKGHEN